jgi:hypothetical protein
MAFTVPTQRPGRRDFLKVGAVGGFALADLFRLRAADAPQAAADAVVLIWLGGGPSHLDTLDPKPDAPAEVRGTFKTIPTAVPGVGLSEHMPKTAKLLDKVALVRSMTTGTADHDMGSILMQTGYQPLPAFEVPSYGSVAAKLLGPRDKSQLPPYVTLPGRFVGSGAGFLGAALNPFVPGSKEDLDGPKRIDAERSERRRRFRQEADAGFKEIEHANDHVKAVGQFYDRAFDLITSPTAREALDVSKEPAAAKEVYGPLGEPLLLARRLVAAGVRFVTVGLGGWDTHRDNFNALEKQLPQVDQAYAAFVADLADRGLLKRTLVVMTGEFGRTPQINGNGGRDHYSKAFSLALAGAGVSGGAVVGKTDRHAAEVTDRPVGASDLAATIYDRLGVDYTQSVESPEGVRVALARDGKPLRELF